MKIKNYIKLLKYFTLIFGVFIPKIAFAISYDEMLGNIESILPAAIDFILMVCYVGGVYLVARGLMMLKQFGMPLTQMSRPGELGGPIGYLFVGAVLLYIPSTIDLAHSTIFGTGETYIAGGAGTGSEIVGYGGEGGGVESRWDDLKSVIFKFINFIGLISFVRGWFIISKAGQPGVQPGTVSKGTVHIIAGILAINIQGFIDILRNTLGI